MKQAKNILREICKTYGIELSFSEAKGAWNTLDRKLGYGDDFYFEVDGMGFRIIHEAAIWDIYVDEIRQMTENCYDLKLNAFPGWLAVEIDWEQTAQNCYADGYGHTFALYDREELHTDDHYIFRTN